MQSSSDTTKDYLELFEKYFFLAYWKFILSDDIKSIFNKKQDDKEKNSLDYPVMFC